VLGARTNWVLDTAFGALSTHNGYWIPPLDPLDVRRFGALFWSVLWKALRFYYGVYFGRHFTFGFWHWAADDWIRPLNYTPLSRTNRFCGGFGPVFPLLYCFRFVRCLAPVLLQHLVVWNALGAFNWSVGSVLFLGGFYGGVM
jgi:hypothetical protein